MEHIFREIIWSFIITSRRRRQWPLHSTAGILFEPLERSTRTSLIDVHVVSLSFSQECRLNGAVLQVCININIKWRALKSPTDIATLVCHIFELVTKTSVYSRATRSPCSKVADNPVSMFIIVTTSTILWTPVHLCDNDWMACLYWKLSLELIKHIGIRVLALVIITCRVIPTRIEVGSKTKVGVIQHLNTVTAVFCLPTSTRSPDDALETIAADGIYYRLEEVVEILACIVIHPVILGEISSPSQPNMYRLITHLNRYLACVSFDIGIARNDIPDSIQIIIIVVTYNDIFREYTRRANNDIESMCDSILDDWNVEILQASTELCFRELSNVSLTAYFLSVRIVCLAITLTKS